MKFVSHKKAYYCPLKTFLQQSVRLYVYILDSLIAKRSLDPIVLHRHGDITNYVPKFQVATMSLEVAEN